MEPTFTLRRALVAALAAMLCCVPLAAALLLAPAAAHPRPPGFTDVEWYSFLGWYGPGGQPIEWHPQETSFTPPGSDYSVTGYGSGANCKEIQNTRTRHSPLGSHLWTIRVDVRWCYRNGRVTKLYPATFHYCWPTSAGAFVGYRCNNPEGQKVRANCYGGSPEHCASTYGWHITGEIRGYQFFSDFWCATSQVYGNGTHKRHGSCSPQAWTYRVAAVQHRAPVGLQSAPTRAQKRTLEGAAR
jgi:hypothetical protein